jgi:hypothetical protein
MGQITPLDVIPTSERLLAVTDQRSLAALGDDTERRLEAAND